MTTRHPSASRALFLSAAALAIVLCYPCTARAQAPNDKNSSPSQSNSDDVNVGLHLGQNASAKDVGLPLYPGSRRRADTKDDSSALNMGLWGGSAGFKMALLKMETNDSPDKVAAFYRKALARYGKVLTCNGENADASATNSPSPNSRGGAKDSPALDCGSGKHDQGEMELKSGTKDKQHVVGISREGSVTTFELVYIETHGLDDNK